MINDMWSRGTNVDSQFNLPSLTDLYIIGKESLLITTSIILNNMESIEFICVDTPLINIINGFQFMLLRARTVLLIAPTEIEFKNEKISRNFNSSHTAPEKEILLWKSACPNANVMFCELKIAREIINNRKYKPEFRYNRFDH